MLDKLLHVFNKFEPPVLFAYIFGSTVTDLKNAQSDLDIAVYFDVQASGIELDHKMALYAEMSRVIKRNDIDIVILNTCTNYILLFEIMTEGKLIFDSDPEARILFEQKTLHAAIDFKEQRDRIFS